MDREEKIQRAAAAERLLSEPLLKEAFEKLDAGYVQLWRNSQDERVLAYAHFGVKAIAAIRRHLELTVQTGKIAESELRFENEKRGTVARLFGAK